MEGRGTQSCPVHTHTLNPFSNPSERVCIRLAALPAFAAGRCIAGLPVTSTPEALRSATMGCVRTAPAPTGTPC